MKGIELLAFFSAKFPALTASAGYAKEAEGEQQLKTILAISVLLIMVIGFAAAFYLRSTHNTLTGNWGLLKAKTSVNRYWATINISMNIARCDRTNIHLKVGEINRFLLKRYSDVSHDAGTDIVTTMYGPSNLETTVPWLANQISPEERIAVLQLLFRIATCDPVLGSKERMLMSQYCKLAGVNPGILAELERQFFAQKEEADRKRNESLRNTNTQHERALMLLGLTSSSTESDIRKSYRTLVKKLHPDRHPNESPQRRKELEAQFVEIQAAYEYLSSRIN